MKTTFRLVLLMLGWLVSGEIRGQTLNSVSSSEDLSQFMTSYYQHPQPGLVDQAIVQVSKSGRCDESSAQAPLIGFFAEVFAANPEKMTQWQAVVDKQDASTKSVMAAAKKLSANPQQMIDMAPLKPELNDMCWGAFFASGKPVYLKALVDRLAYLDERKDCRRYLTAASAKWSISSNSKQDPVVLKELQKLKADVPPEIRKQVEDAIAKSPSTIGKETIEVVRTQKQKGIW